MKPINEISNEEMLKDVTFVRSSSYRIDLLLLLSKHSMPPTAIKELTGYEIHYISKILKELTERKLVECISEDTSRSRIYKLTEYGHKIINLLLKDLMLSKFTTEELNFTDKEINELILAIHSFKKVEELTHDFFPYPARFPPEIPRFFIEKFTNEGDVVLDPFVGGGTTLVEASILNRKSYGIDLNKFAVFLSEVKTTPLHVSQLNNFFEKIKEALKLNINGDAEDEKLFDNVDIELIPREIRKEISMLVSLINEFPGAIRNFFLCCLIATCNILSDRRYRNKKTIIPIFLKKCEKFINKLDEYSKKKKSDVFIFHDDAKNVLKYLAPNSVDLIVTSPSYPDVHTEYNNLLLGGRRPSKLFYNTIGYKETRPASDYRLKGGDTYFDLLDNILKNLVEVLKEGKKFVLVIGLKNREYLQKLKKVISKNKLKLIGEFARSIPHRKWYTQLPEKKNKGIIFEYILIYEKPKPLLDKERTEWYNIEIEFRKNKQDTIHDIHPYPGSFIPPIPNKIIKKHFHDEGQQQILDNFMGHGTTLVEALKLGKRSIGIDLNPLAYLLAKVKITPIPFDKLREEINKINELLNIQLKRLDNQKIIIPSESEINKWYEKRVKLELGSINWYINTQIHEEDIKDFFKIAFSNTVVEASGRDYNFITDNMPLETPKYFPVQEIFNFHLNRMFKLFYDFHSSIRKYVECRPVLGDSRDLSFIPSESVDLAITSPPYLNGLDYLKMHRLTFYWLNIPFKDKITMEIGSRSKRGRKDMIIEYKLNMKRCMNEVFRVLKTGGYYYMVIGDTYWHGISLQTPFILKKIGKEIGFKVVDEFELLLPGHFYKAHEKNVEWLLVFQK